MEPRNKVTALPVTPRLEAGDLMLVPPPATKCSHTLASFTVDLQAGKCWCRDCGEEVSPLFVLHELMQKESRWSRAREQHRRDLERLEKRSRTQCDHCGKMTRISHR